jgi:hypothetical protein
MLSRHAVRRGDLERAAGQRCSATRQSTPDHPVLDYVAERLAADLEVIVADPVRRVALADLDLEDRLGVLTQMAPRPDRVEQVAGAAADRGVPAVEARLGPVLQGLALDQQDPQVGAGDRGGQREAGHAAADDDQIEPGISVSHRPTVPHHRGRLQGHAVAAPAGIVRSRHVHNDGSDSGSLPND